MSTKMATVTESRKFSLFNVDGRNNKFWNITLYDDGTVEVHFGPQGGSGIKKTFSGGRAYFDRKIREKTSPKHAGGAYVENKVLDAVVATSSGKSLQKHALAQRAVKDIGAGQPELKALITYLADVNAHNIYEASGGKITYDVDSGMFSTTQGVISLDQIQEARSLLLTIAGFTKKKDFASTDFKKALNPYLSLIPQKGLVRQLDFATMFDASGIQKQNDILDGLESSYATVIADAQKGNGQTVEEEVALFNVRMAVTDDKTFQAVKRYYNKTKGSHRDVANFDVKSVWDLSIEHMSLAFERRIAAMAKIDPKTNIMRLWHGTKCSNILSILKAGMIIPPASSSYVCGRAYGNGIYFSDQSTKSIRYATGAWGGGGRTDRKFMFLVDVAMGRMHVPATGGYNSSYKPPLGYDSCFAKAGISGVINNEMIVYHVDQVKPMHLIELSAFGK
jgi:poly [ADP-ribose] polymerase 2/3/4